MTISLSKKVIRENRELLKTQRWKIKKLKRELWKEKRILQSSREAIAREKVTIARKRVKKYYTSDDEKLMLMVTMIKKLGLSGITQGIQELR